IWNAFRLVKGWNVSADVEQPESSKIAIEWFKQVLAKSALLLEDQFGKYRISEALMNLYTLFWDEFSAWYLEMIKPTYGSPIDKETYEATLRFFDELMRLLHPFMPFITEELWQAIIERKEGESLMVQSIKELNRPYDETFLSRIESLKEIVGNIRSIRQQKNLSPREALALQIIGESHVCGLESVLTKMANLSSIESVTTADDTAVMFRINTTEYAVPMGSLIDKDAEIAKMREELAYLEKFLKSVEAKLNNPNFVSKAPEKIIAIERKKQSDAKEKIAMLTESIEKLSK
ncbi:MAG: class I tRNA ligase family protein, partial [Bacteroidaceae bacterium]|nr:class I tRNA ligase family protein [Bacteroidaceae bacterium]